MPQPRNPSMAWAEYASTQRRRHQHQVLRQGKLHTLHMMYCYCIDGASNDDSDGELPDNTKSPALDAELKDYPALATPPVEKHMEHIYKYLHSPFTHLTDLTKKDIDTDEYAPANLYLGCKHEATAIVLNNGVATV